MPFMATKRRRLALQRPASSFNLEHRPSAAQHDNQQKNIFPFSKLPAEVQNTIYRYLFIANDTIINVEDNTEKHFQLDILVVGSARRLRASRQVPFVNQSSQPNPGFIKPYQPAVVNAAILRVGRDHDISRAARSMLYACNKFRFSSPNTLHAFLNVIGPNTRFLRHLELDAPFYALDVWPPNQHILNITGPSPNGFSYKFSAKAGAKWIFPQIAQLEALQSFHVEMKHLGPVDPTFSRGSPTHDMAVFFQPLIKLLLVRHNYDISKVFQIITFSDLNRRQGDDRACPSFTARVKKMVEPSFCAPAISNRVIRRGRAKQVDYTE